MAEARITEERDCDDSCSHHGRSYSAEDRAAAHSTGLVMCGMSGWAEPGVHARGCDRICALLESSRAAGKREGAEGMRTRAEKVALLGARAHGDAEDYFGSGAAMLIAKSIAALPVEEG